MEARAVQATGIGWDVLEQTPGLLQVGDIMETQNSGLLSRLVRWFSRRRGQGPSWASHTALVLTSEPL